MKTNCYTVKGYRILQTSAIRWLILLMALVASGLTGFSQSSDYAGAVIKKLASRTLREEDMPVVVKGLLLNIFQRSIRKSD